MRQLFERLALFLLLLAGPACVHAAPAHDLFVAAHKRRVYVYDVDHGHRLVRTIATPWLNRPRGLTADKPNGMMYVSFRRSVVAFNPLDGRVKWRKDLDAAPADRLDVTPDGGLLFVPSGLRSRKTFWYVLDARTGQEKAKIDVSSGAHNTLISRDGKTAYLASLKYRYLTLVDTSSLRIRRSIGPFQGFIRPFTINGDQTLAAANVQDLLGFQTADLRTGRVAPPVLAPDGPHHESFHTTRCHGIGMTPDNTELWLVDSAGDRVIVFDLTDPARKVKNIIATRPDPGWITFDLDGRWAYLSTGEVFDARSKKFAALLKDERGRVVQSEKMLDLKLAGGAIAEVGSQFGIGR